MARGRNGDSLESKRRWIEIGEWYERLRRAVCIYNLFCIVRTIEGQSGNKKIEEKISMDVMNEFMISMVSLEIPFLFFPLSVAPVSVFLGSFFRPSQLAFSP
ncbi:hypothetical protein L2E82_16865 [Cichorium intybus]|uniref:Uncharacterized protein n=1 Tax=Cichorium intybus TaxID=13427 RepID=A0ACB9F624_CICIN|nr:hypothetical protein L2E82_16865 [Cichorium intybus]